MDLLPPVILGWTIPINFPWLYRLRIMFSFKGYRPLRSRAIGAGLRFSNKNVGMYQQPHQFRWPQDLERFDHKLRSLEREREEAFLTQTVFSSATIKAAAQTHARHVKETLPDVADHHDSQPRERIDLGKVRRHPTSELRLRLSANSSLSSVVESARDSLWL